MIVGIGIDIVEIKRMEYWTENSKLIERFFHSEEISLASSKKNNAAQTFAARFAAKEAFGKALGTGLSKIALKDIAVINNENGKPQIKLYGTAQEEFINSGATKVHISLSHEKENAIAIIILEKE
ncbi:MAG: holo-ACP synthase [Treponema sp.]|nr:holo-ACP synthase [Treponema sp.]MCL2250702.1 holo-ACP synthase [Treponema sp.]